MLSRSGTPRKSRHWPRLLLVIPFIALLYPPFYSMLEPTLFGMPFFYWYQLAWILLTALIIGLIYLLEQ